MSKPQRKQTKQYSAAPVNTDAPIADPKALAQAVGQGLSAVPAATILAAQTYHEGPLPDPATLHRYEQINPGITERIVAMAEREQQSRLLCNEIAVKSDADHRTQLQGIEGRRIDGINSSDKRGQIIGAIVSVIAMGLAITALYMGNAWVAGLFVSMPVMAMIRAIRSPVKNTPSPTKVKK